MKNIATGGVLERIRKLAPPHVIAPFRTPEEWREWQLAEGQSRAISENAGARGEILRQASEHYLCGMQEKRVHAAGTGILQGK